MLNSISDRLVSYYSDRATQGDSGAQQVGWKSTAAQTVRFGQLAKILPGEDFSLNDFGCGLGDLADFLAGQGFENFRYRGYDMLQSMVDSAGTRHPRHSHLEFLPVEKAEDMLEADYTVASGVFNIRFDLSDENWLRYIIDSLDTFHQKSRRGFAFNALTRYSDPHLMKPELYYADPLLLFDYCKKNFSKNIALLHDYQEYDFTILVKKT